MRDRTLRAVLAAFTLTVVLLLFSTWMCVRILSGVRAYVGGEGLYSKAQKNATYYLQLYVITHDENWYTRFLNSLAVPEGDRDARLALSQPSPDIAAARRGFIAGANSPDDTDDLIFVFRRLRRNPYVNEAIDIWRQADAYIAELRQMGEGIHRRIQDSSGTDPAVVTDTIAIESLNRSLTVLEDRFSATLGAGARATAWQLLSAIGGLALILWLMGNYVFRRMLSAFAREREALRATIDNAPLGIVLVDAPNGRIRMGNTQAWQLLGRPHTNYAESEYADGWRARDADQVELEWPDFPVARALAGETVHARNLEWERPDGTRLWLRVSAAPIRRSGEIVGAVSIFYDISEERRYEETMIRQSNELARSNADLENFAYITSHDLQEPLRNIATFSQLLARNYNGRLDDNADKIISFISEAVGRMNLLIHDLLSYSRINNVDAAPMVTVDLNNVLEWASSNLKAKLLESGARVSADSLPTVRGDQVQLVQVFQNLIDNAVKYGGKPPEVRISAQPLNGNWKIAVSDNGDGIEPEYHDQIFAIFRRLHGGDIPGTGIGLALTRRAIERHGGRIWVESTPGQGASFVFTLPAAE